jgi:hypothetical protein
MWTLTNSRFLLALVAIVALAGCGGNNTYSPTVVGPVSSVPPVVAVSIVKPSQSTPVTGGTVQLSADVTGTSDTGVTWSVVSEGGGTITSTGLYTAPTTPGTYTIEATSVADTTKSATTTITVLPSTGTVIGVGQ